jgi:hypothetical protein
VYMEPVRADDHFHAEAQAMLRALQVVRQAIIQGNTNSFHIMTDCKVLQQIMSTGTVEDTPSWQARAIVVQCVMINREGTQRKVEIN